MSAFALFTLDVKHISLKWQIEDPDLRINPALDAKNKCPTLLLPARKKAVPPSMIEPWLRHRYVSAGTAYWGYNK